mgnify:CR=1 FL=1
MNAMLIAQSIESGAELESIGTVSYTHLRAHETPEHLVCRLLLEKKKTTKSEIDITYTKRTL